MYDAALLPVLVASVKGIQCAARNTLIRANLTFSSWPAVVPFQLHWTGLQHMTSSSFSAALHCLPHMTSSRDHTFTPGSDFSANQQVRTDAICAGGGGGSIRGGAQAACCRGRER
jgi:hypothetical protein